MAYRTLASSDVIESGQTVKISVSYQGVPFFTPTEEQLVGAVNSHESGLTPWFVATSANPYAFDNGADIFVRTTNKIRADALTAQVFNQLQFMNDTTNRLFGLRVDSTSLVVGSSSSDPTDYSDPSSWNPLDSASSIFSTKSAVVIIIVAIAIIIALGFAFKEL